MTMTAKTIITNDQAKDASIETLFDMLDMGPDAAKAVAEDRYQGLSSEEASRRLELYGENALEEKKHNVWAKIASGFWGPIPWMIEVAAILSLVIGHYPDFIFITFLLIFNAGIDYWNDHKATNALDALKNQLALMCRVLRDGSWREIEARRLVPGDLVRLRLGDIIPADVKLVEGKYLSVDQAALTGESLPVSKGQSDTAFSGSVVKQGEMDGLVTSTGVNTFFGRTAKLVASAGNISHFQKTVMKIGNFLIVMAIGLSIVLTSVQLVRGDSFLDLLQFILVLVIASIPVALPAVFSVTMALGTLALSKEKAIVSTLQSVEELAGVDVLCSDKTGTLTKNQLTLSDPVLFEAADNHECYLAAALASKAEDKDSIDLAVIEALGDPSEMAQYHQEEFVPFDPITKRTEATVLWPGGQKVRYTKGAPQVILEMSDLDAAGKKRGSEVVDQMASKGYRSLGVAESTDDGHSWRFLGILPMFDPPRDDSAETIQQAKAYGLDVKMVTGDNVAIGAEISGRLGLGTHLLPADEVFDSKTDPEHLDGDLAARIEKADGFAQVFPEHKYAIVKSLQERGHYVAMTGDGVNDAPALKQADVGIAVQGATDAARAAADLILTAPGLSAVVHAIEMSREIFQRMVAYAVYRIAMTFDIMLFVVLATLFFDFRPLSAIMIVVLALLDDIPVMTIAYDRMTISQNPSKFRVKEMIAMAGILGVLSVVETFGLLALGMGIMDNAGWQTWLQSYLGVKMDLTHIQSMMFLQLVAGGHFLLFVTRSRNSLYSRPFPAWQLFWAIVGTQALSVMMCGFGWLVPKLPWALIAVVYIYNAMWMFLLDFVKVGAIEWYEGRPKMRHHKRYVDLTTQSLQAHPTTR